jgi:hypothetical protein
LNKEDAVSQDSVRIPPLSFEEFTAEQKALVGDWHHLNFSRVLVQHPGMYRVFLPFIDKVIRSCACARSRSAAMSTRDITM